MSFLSQLCDLEEGFLMIDVYKRQRYDRRTGRSREAKSMKEKNTEDKINTEKQEQNEKRKKKLPLWRCV